MRILEKYAIELDREGLRERIRQTRAKQGLTQVAIAKKMNISLKTYTLFESMDDVPQWKHINSFIDATSVEREWLLHGQREWETEEELKEILELRDFQTSYQTKEDDFKIINFILSRDKELRKLIVSLLVHHRTILENEMAKNK